MGLRAVEPRVGVILTVSLTVLLMLRRAGAFRSAPTAAVAAVTAAFSRCRGRSYGSAAGRHTGPEGTALPEVMHKTVGPGELKVRPGGRLIRTQAPAVEHLLCSPAPVLSCRLRMHVRW